MINNNIIIIIIIIIINKLSSSSSSHSHHHAITPIRRHIKPRQPLRMSSSSTRAHKRRHIPGQQVPSRAQSRDITRVSGDGVGDEQNSERGHNGWLVWNWGLGFGVWGLGFGVALTGGRWRTSACARRRPRRHPASTCSSQGSCNSCSRCGANTRTRTGAHAHARTRACSPRHNRISLHPQRRQWHMHKTLQ